MGITYANDELVARAWLKTVAGLPVNQIGTIVPQDNTTWAASGFVQITVTGDASHKYYRLRRPVITAVCWAVAPGKQTPPWGKACDLAEAIAEACWSFEPSELSLGVTGAPAVRTLQANIIQPPRRAFGDAAEYAKYTVDFELIWNETD
ncbi:hypothetical protein [Streptomyces sp. NPDC055013]